MGYARLLALLLACSCLGLGCQAKQEVSAEPGPKKAKKAAAKAEKAEHAEEEHGDPGKFIVPFAWEAARDEPLAQTRAFLADVLTDNRGYMEHGDKFFAAFADSQTPRATVLTCADSRVHSGAWDVTPENDDFIIRNIGNQVENARGSLEYGVEHLKTPLLMVLGHTGCGAVKAAMGDVSKLSAPIQHELQHLHPPKPAAGSSPEGAWVDAVIANVNDQVSAALKYFGKDVQTGELTVVGAVYDFRNDLRQGAGKLVIVNVNGNAEPERMAAFVDAVAGKHEARDAKEPAEKRGKPAAKFDQAAAAAEIAAQLAKLRAGPKPEAPVAQVHSLGHTEPAARAEHGGHGEH